MRVHRWQTTTATALTVTEPPACRPRAWAPRGSGTRSAASACANAPRAMSTMGTEVAAKTHATPTTGDAPMEKCARTARGTRSCASAHPALILAREGCAPQGPHHRCCLRLTSAIPFPTRTRTCRTCHHPRRTTRRLRRRTTLALHRTLQRTLQHIRLHERLVYQLAFVTYAKSAPKGPVRAGACPAIQK